MPLFRRKRKKTPQRPEGMTENPLEAVPVRLDDVETVATSEDGSVMLEIDITGRRGETYRKISSIFGYNNKKNVQLDGIGGFFWQQIDGRKNLLAIAQALKEKLGRGDQEVYAAIVNYVKDLMKRNLIYLKMPRTHTGR
jgi:hypothetical protein